MGGESTQVRQRARWPAAVLAALVSWSGTHLAEVAAARKEYDDSGKLRP